MFYALLACAAVTYDVADLQLDIAGDLPADAETVHVCIEGQGEHDQGAGNGRVAVTALWADRPAVVRVEVLDDVGGQLLITDSVTFDAGDSYIVAEANAPDGTICAADGHFAPDGADNILLGVRFSEP